MYFLDSHEGQGLKQSGVSNRGGCVCALLIFGNCKHLPNCYPIQGGKGYLLGDLIQEVSILFSLLEESFLNGTPSIELNC